MRSRRLDTAIPASNKTNDDGRNQGSRKSLRALASTWSPGHSWRNRQAGKKTFLTSLERRYLRDVLWALERSNKPFMSEFVLILQGDRAREDVKLPAPLAKLVAKGLVEVDKCGEQLSCILTAEGLEGIENWMLARPPNFQLMFPNLYRQLAVRSGHERASRNRPADKRGPCTVCTGTKRSR